jgi:hypothetical protein
MELDSVLDAQHYFELPAELSPKSIPLHDTEMRLEMRRAGHSHSVKVYAPEEVWNREALRRFAASREQC